MLFTIFRVCIIVLLLIGLLKIKKTRLRHLPARRTRISRRYGEHTLWAERLVSALADMLIIAAAKQQESSAAAAGADRSAPSPVRDARSPLLPPRARQDREGWGPLLRPLIQQIEDRVNAALEDSGVTVWSDFQVHSLGTRPPALKAVHIVTSGGGGAGAGAAAGTSAGAGAGVGVGVGADSVVGEAEPAAEPPGPSPGENPGGPPLPPSVMELEAEVEYSGGASASLRADIALARGRQLPVHIHVGDIRYVRVHVRVLFSLHYEEATMESPRKPFLLATVWLESDPAFELKLSTSITRLHIRDCFLVPVLAKFFILRFIRSRMRRRRQGPQPPAAEGGAAGAAGAAGSKEGGLTVRIPLPEDVVDGGEPWFFFPRGGADNTSESPAASTRLSMQSWPRRRL